jgi:flagellar biosynthesis GTPase FlhF
VLGEVPLRTRTALGGARAALLRCRGRSRWVVAAVAGVALVGLHGCDKPRDRTRDEAAIAAAVEQARQEQAEADRQMRERAARQELDRRDAEQAVIDEHLAQEEARRAKQVAFEQKLRSVMIDPTSMQIRNQRLTADGSALCAEVSGKNKQGVYVGFRRVVATESFVSFDQDPEDMNREPQFRFAAMAQATGCY